MKVSTMEKNKNRTIEAEQRMLTQQVQSLKRRLETQEQTLEIKKNEIKEKDLFIQSNLTRMTSKQDVPILMAQL